MQCDGLPSHRRIPREVEDIPVDEYGVEARRLANCRPVTDCRDRSRMHLDAFGEQVTRVELR